MAIKKLFSWLIVGIVLFIAFAVVLMGNLFKSNIASTASAPQKSEMMKEVRWVKKAEIKEIFIECDIYIDIDGVRTYAGMVEVSSKNIRVTNSGAVDSLSVLLTGSLPPPEANLNLGMDISVRGKAKKDMPEGFFKRTAEVPNLFYGNIDVFISYFDDARGKLPWARSDEGYYINVFTGETKTLVKKDGRWKPKN